MDEGWTRFVLDEYAFDYTKLQDATLNLVRQAGTQSAFNNVVTSFRAGAPHVRVEVDRYKAESLKVSIGDVFKHWRKLFRPRTYRHIPQYVQRLRGARQMKVMERWREFDADPRLAGMLADPELQRLSREIFGELPAAAR